MYNYKVYPKIHKNDQIYFPKKYSYRYSQPLRLGSYTHKVLSSIMLIFENFDMKVKLD